jgi:hypothetical protein
MRWSREKPLFLAPFHPKALWEHVFRGFIGEAVSFHPVWQKTASNSSWSRWRSPTKRGLNRRRLVASPTWSAASRRTLRLSVVGTLKRYSKALEYEYRVKIAALGTLKRYYILSLTLYLELYNAYFPPVRLSLSARLISRGTVFFSHSKSATAGL